MRGKGVMRGLSQPKSFSRRKTLKSFNVKGKLENVVLIDVEGDICENVIIIDASESVEEGSSGSGGGKRFPSPGVISIDDDETDNMDDPKICAECGGDLDSDASSSKSSPAPDFMHKSVGLDDDECQVIREKKSAFKLSKCKKTYTGKTPCGKRFGLSPESEDSSSGSDCSDCELMEGSVGKLREQWEKAFQRKKCNARNGRSGLEDQSSASGSHNNTPATVHEENRTEQCAETPVSSGSSYSNIQKQNTSAFETSSDKYTGGTSPHPGMGSPFVKFDKKVDHESFSWSKYGPTAEEWFSHVKDDVIFGRETNMKDPPLRDGDQDSCQVPLNSDPHSSNLHQRNRGSNGKEKLQSKEPSASIPKLSEEKQVDNGVTPSEIKVGTVFDEPSSVKTSFVKMPVVGSEIYSDREKVLSGDSSQYDETQIKQSCSEAEESYVESPSGSKKCDERDTLHVQGVDATASGEKDIVIDREKLKETVEYKLAVEEEWASRQRELQIQAEEAQRLRKRRKAESMRLLDMERRQKQRLEEIRETQKKDEENMNLKEQLRIEVRKELSQLELSCINMASLLRSLGIPVGGGFCPLSHEVHAAYKRAVLRFHPDRASKTNIREQVEAEEKFKLISRMKEKFLATSCH
ncbi:hypothetical protein QQP08_006746 [Theobroma cacao]|nr:hypothetical protein QQP08_006746 [Theobroma cacao]